MLKIKSFLFSLLTSPAESFTDAFTENSDGLVKSRRNTVLGNALGGMLQNLISGFFFVSLLTYMKAGNAYIGLVTVATTACGFIQAFSPIVLERIPKRKTLLLWLRIIYYFINVVFLGVVALLPVSGGLRLGLFMGGIIVMNLVNSFSNPGFCIWHITNIPDSKRASYFSLSSMFIGVTNALTALLAGVFVDFYKGSGSALLGGSAEITGILLLRVVAAVFGAVELWLYYHIVEQPYGHEDNACAERPRIASILAAPLKNPAFLACVAIACLWTFASGLVGMYFQVYLIEDLKLSYTYLYFVGILNIPIMLVMMPLWARIVKRISWLWTLNIAVFLYAFAYLINLFIAPGTEFLYVVVVLYCNIIAPGITIVFSNLPYLHMPKRNQTSFLSFYSSLNSLSGLIGSAAGTLFIGLTEGRFLTLLGYRMQNRLYINLVQFGFMLVLVVVVFLAARYLGKVQKAETPPAV